MDAKQIYKIIFQIAILSLVLMLFSIAVGSIIYNISNYHEAYSSSIKIDNATYQVSLDYVGHPEVAWDMCISNLQVLTNQGWVEANATQRAEVICWFADMPSNSLYDECLIGNVDIHGFCLT